MWSWCIEPLATQLFVQHHIRESYTEDDKLRITLSFDGTASVTGVLFSQMASSAEIIPCHEMMLCVRAFFVCSTGECNTGDKSTPF